MALNDKFNDTTILISVWGVQAYSEQFFPVDDWYSAVIML